MLLETLSQMRTVSFIEGCTEEDAHLAVEGLAKIHLNWWENPALLDQDWHTSYADWPFQDWWKLYPDRLAAILPDFQLPDSFFEVGEDFATGMAKFISQLEGAPFTCVHRDIHVDNILFGAVESQTL